MGSLRSIRKNEDTYPHRGAPGNVVAIQLILDALGLSLKQHSLSHIHHTIHISHGAVSLLSYHIWRVYFPKLVCDSLNDDLAEMETWFWDKEDNQPLDVGLKPRIRAELVKIRPMFRPPDGVPLLYPEEDWTRLLSITWWWKRHPKSRVGKCLGSCVEKSLGNNSADVWHVDEALRVIKDYKLQASNY